MFRHLYGYIVLTKFLGFPFGFSVSIQLVSFFVTNYILILNSSQYDLWNELRMHLIHSEDILRSVQSIIIQMDKEMNVIYLNNSFLDYIPENLLGKNISEFSFFDFEFKEKLKKEKKAQKIFKTFHNGKPHHYSILANEIEKKGEFEYFVVINDLTDSKNLEEQEMLKLKAITSLKAKTEFIASISHEIRNPLQVISYSTEILSPSLNLEDTKSLDNIRRSTKLLKTIIGDILDMSKIEAGKMNLTIQQFNFQECIENSISMNSNAAYEKKLKIYNYLDPYLPLYFDGDESRLVQVMNNIISNAVKYTKQGIISIKSILVKKNENFMRFECKDTGVGINKVLMNNLFQPFQQINPKQSTNLSE
jgi:PAS domain S-box-containing protein